MVELEARLSDDLDLDADAGALLAHPERIVAVEPLDAARVESIARRVEAAKAE